jgi:4-hydroxy-2-oxoheptanedioate aldolase
VEEKAEEEVPMPRLNQAIALFEQKKPVIGSFVPSGSIEQAIAAGDSAADFCIFEMEHSGFDFRGLQLSLQFLLNRRKLAQSGSLAPQPTPLVRVPSNARERNEWIHKQCMDYGVFGIVCPHLNTPEEAEHLIQSCRYPHKPDARDRHPEGLRGTAPGNAVRYWGAASTPEYIQKADLWPLDPDGEMLLMPLIEEAEGVKNITDILKTNKGVGAIFLGEVDLSVSLGHPMETTHPDVVAARDRVFKACKNAGVPVGCLGFQEPAKRLEMGFDFVVIGVPQVDAVRKAAGRA